MKNLAIICLGAALFSGVALALYRYLPGPEAGAAAQTAVAPATPAAPVIPEAPATPAAENTREEAPAARNFLPLMRSLSGVEKKYGQKMELTGTILLAPGPVEGAGIRTYRTETATDDLLFKDERLYKRSLAFNISEIEGEVSAFCSSVYLLALYPTAYDTDYSEDKIPGEVRVKAENFGAKCAALRASAGQPAEQYEIEGDYVFGCINSDNIRLKFEVSSEGLLKAEKFARGQQRPG